MWWASKAGIAEADEHKKDPTSQSGKFHDHLRLHLPIYNDTDHWYDLHIPTFTNKTLQKDKHRLPVAPPRGWFDDDVGNDGTMIFKLEEAKSQNNLSPRYSVVPFAIYADVFHIPMTTRSSDLGGEHVDTRTLLCRRSAKEVAVSMRVPWLVHILSTLRDVPVEFLCHGRGNAFVRLTRWQKGGFQAMCGKNQCLVVH